MRKKQKRDNMDDETAMAFAGHKFSQLYPKESCPEWLPRCTVIGYHFDKDDNYIISFSLTPLATKDAFAYFTVSVNPSNAETLVLFDIDPNTFHGEDHHGFKI